MEYILETQNLSKEYDSFKLKNINLKLTKGSIMGFIGENGAGKTTTLKLILNLIKKSSGSVDIFGKDNIQDEKSIKENLGVVLEESYFHDYLKPTNINLIMKNIFPKWDTVLFYEYLEKFSLPKEKIVKEFSKGMKTKLSIACALSHHPKLLILDEATSGLDPIVRNEILDEFLEFIQNEECSILLSSHITSDLERIADYITFIHKGEIVFSKSKDDLLNEHGILRCGLEDFEKIDKSHIIGYRKNQFGYEVLICGKEQIKQKHKDFVIDNAKIDEIMLFYTKKL